MYPNHFFHEGPLDLTFPDEWDVEMCKIACHDEEAMTPEEIQRKISNPIGTELLGELAKDRKEAVILVDDIVPHHESWINFVPCSKGAE